jgi:hypothetical protein
MTSDEIKSLFKEIFFEDKWEINESTKSRYGKDWPIFYIKRQSNKTNSKLACVRIDNYIIGTTILDDVWELSIDGGEIRIVIPGTSFKRNPKDVGDPKAFVGLLKDKIEEYFKIKEMKNSLNNDICLMKNDPNKIIRDYKLKQLGI